MSSVLRVLDLVGGLGVFLIGMRWMSDGIQRRAGDRLRGVLQRMTGNRFAGVLTGFGVTSLVQSSSATTVLLVSLVNAGLIGLRQSIGVVMGANIGTTMTAWIVSLVGFRFRITDIALPAIAIALPFHFGRRQDLREFADILIGFGLLFLGLSLMRDAVPDMSGNPEVLSFLQNWTGLGLASTLLFVIIGALLTIVVQSSSAAITITITMAFRGWIGFPAAAAIVLGENVGTTITAFVASLPMGTAARRTARAHLLFNLFGVAWMLAVFGPFTRLVDVLMAGPVTDPANIPLHLSLFHTLFNVANTAILLPFVGVFTRLVERLVPERMVVSEAGEYRLALVAPNLPDALESNLITIRGELARMSRCAGQMLGTVMEACAKPELLPEARAKLEDEERRADEMYTAITAFLGRSMREPMGEDRARSVAAAQRIAGEIEGMTDACFGIGTHLERLHRKGRRIHPEGEQELFDYAAQVREFLRYNESALDRSLDRMEVSVAEEIERTIDRVRRRLAKRSRKSLEKKRRTDVRGELIFLEIIRHLEQIGDNCLAVARAIPDLV